MSFHFVKQLDAMQCGVACLALICKYYNNAYSIETLSEDRIIFPKEGGEIVAAGNEPFSHAVIQE